MMNTSVSIAAGHDVDVDGAHCSVGGSVGGGVSGGVLITGGKSVRVSPLVLPLAVVASVVLLLGTILVLLLLQDPLPDDLALPLLPFQGASNPGFVVKPMEG